MRVPRRQSAWARVLTVACLAIAATLFGCASDCDRAEDKLDSCAEEIRKEQAARGGAGLPIGFEGECSEDDRCVASCVDLAECPAIASVIVDGGQPPNGNASKDAKELYACLQSCENTAAE